VAAGHGLLVALSVFVCVILAARLLDTPPGRRFLGARIGRLRNWWAARQAAASEGDQEYDELKVILRRQQLGAHLDRLRRILATDESMSATRQIANRLAYRWLQHEFERTPGILPWMPDDDIARGWSPPATAIGRTTYHSAHREPEVLEIGYRIRL
jgi:hypothetical protein